MSKISTWSSKTPALLSTGLLILYLLISGNSIDAQTIDANDITIDTALANQVDTVNEPDRMADDFITASLVIAEPGEVMYSILGHAALHMLCPHYNLD